MLRDAVADELCRWFRDHPEGIVAEYLVGSVARGQARADSDVDVGVVLASGRPTSLDDFDRLAHTQDELSGSLRRRIDLVPLDGALPDLLHRVLCDRVLLLDGDHERRIEFEILARNEYFAIAPRHEHYPRGVLGRV